MGAKVHSLDMSSVWRLIPEVWEQYQLDDLFLLEIIV